VTKLMDTEIEYILYNLSQSEGLPTCLHTVLNNSETNEKLKLRLTFQTK